MYLVFCVLRGEKIKLSADVRPASSVRLLGQAAEWPALAPPTGTARPIDSSLELA